jgi:hypothetical protein
MSGFRPNRVILHHEVETMYAAIEAAAKAGRKEQAALWKGFQRAVLPVRADGQWGEVIPSIPAYFVWRYGARNLYGIDLAFFHRAFYTIQGRDVIFLDLVDHAAYDKWFPGRKRR